jgi:hypothetical protein
MGPRNQFQGMNSASLCSLAGRDDNLLPPRFLAPIGSLKIPALESFGTETLRVTRSQAWTELPGLQDSCEDMVPRGITRDHVEPRGAPRTTWIHVIPRGASWSHAEPQRRRSVEPLQSHRSYVDSLRATWIHVKPRGASWSHVPRRKLS